MEGERQAGRQQGEQQLEPAEQGQPHGSAQQSQHHGFEQEQQKYAAPRAAQRHQQAHFGDPLLLGDAHDAEDADRPDQQRDNAEPANRQLDDGEYLVEAGQHVLLGGEGKILGAVAGDQHPPDLGGDLGLRLPGAIDDVDLLQPLLVEQRLGVSGGQIDHVVQIKAEKLPLGGQHPGHPKTAITGAQQTARRIAAGKQLRRHLGPQHRIGAGHGTVIRRQKTPLHQGKSPAGERRRACAQNGGAAGQSAAAHLPLPLHHRERRLYPRQSGQSISILQQQGTAAGEDAGRAAGGFGLARGHGDQPGAKLGEAVEQIEPEPLADTGEQGHRGDPDGDTQRRQQAATAPGQQGAPEPEQQIGGAHQPPLHCPLRRLLTGSCRAAREAGSQLKNSPVSRAAGMVQRVASRGTASGKLGQITPARATRA